MERRTMDLHDTFELAAGDAVLFECSHDCEILFLSELEYARWRKTGEPEPHSYTRMPITLTAKAPGTWHLLVNFLGTSSMAELDIPPTYSISR
jgi:hypothetical protein